MAEDNTHMIDTTANATEVEEDKK
jgi:signal recognition particle subunit SRP68